MARWVNGGKFALVATSALLAAIAAGFAEAASGATIAGSIRWYRLSFSAYGSYTGFYKTPGGQTNRGSSTFRGESQTSAALELHPGGVLTMVTSFRGVVFHGHVTQTAQPAGCTPDVGSLDQLEADPATYRFAVNATLERRRSASSVHLDFFLLAPGKAIQDLSEIRCTTPDGNVIVTRQAVHQVIQAAAYTYPVCSTNQTKVTQRLTGAPAFGRPFTMSYSCHATIDDAIQNHAYDGRYTLDFLPCPGNGRKRC
jgi:hypothetical protein